MTRRVKGNSPYTSTGKISEDIGANADYAVGYRKPPAGTQFKPGTSGNPKGRPKGKRNLGTEIRNVYMGSVVIREGKKTRRVTRLEALLLKHLERAFRGDERAILTTCKIAAQLGLFSVQEETFDWYLENIRSNLSVLTDAELDSVQQIFTRLAGA